MARSLSPIGVQQNLSGRILISSLILYMTVPVAVRWYFIRMSSAARMVCESGRFRRIVYGLYLGNEMHQQDSRLYQVHIPGNLYQASAMKKKYPWQ